MFNLEKDLERKLIKEVEALGGRCLKWVCPGWAGVPDRIVLLPGGRIYFVETKKPKGGVLSALQRKWSQWLTELGFVYRIVWDNSDLTNFIAVTKAPNIKRECWTCVYFPLTPHEKPCCYCENESHWELYDEEV